MKSSDTSNTIQLLSRRDAANLLRVDPRTIRRYECAGLIKPIRLNCRVTRYLREDIEKLVANYALQAPTINSPTQHPADATKDEPNA